VRFCPGPLVVAREQERQESPVRLPLSVTLWYGADHPSRSVRHPASGYPASAPKTASSPARPPATGINHEGRMEATASSSLEILPPHSSDATALAALSEPVRAWFTHSFGRPTAAQRAAWPTLAEGKNLLLSAPTGAGKTLAAFAPILSELLTGPPTGSVCCLYITPLKALGNDVRKSLRYHLAGMQGFLTEALHYRRVPRVVLRTGDTPARARQQLWADPPEILLTTPESLALLLSHGGAADLFGGLLWVIVDEVHALAAGKRGADLSLSLERLTHLVEGEEDSSADRLQRIGLSATATPLDEAARFLTGVGRPCVIARADEPSPLELTLRPLAGEGRIVTRLVAEALPELESSRSTLIFTNTRALAERLAWALRRCRPEWDDQVAVHHSSLSAVRRRRIERQMKRGRLRVVVSSTSLELGIDVGTVDLVILVHPPGDVVRLLQRVGRAGHAPGRPRRGLVLTATTAELLEAVVTGASGLSGQCEPLRVPAHPLDVLCQQLLGMAATLPWTPDEAHRLICRAHPYRDLPRSDLDDCLAYLSGTPGGQSSEEGDSWLPSRLRWEEGCFTLANERMARLLRRNLGTILAEEPCRVVAEGDNPFFVPPSRSGEGEKRRDPTPQPPPRSGEGEPDKREEVVLGEVSTDCSGSPSPLRGGGQKSGVASHLIGHVDEAFAERLQPGDRFLLDGRCLECRRFGRAAGRGGTPELVVAEVVGRPRVPVWAGEGWPLSAELARRLYVFRNAAAEALRDGPRALAALLQDEYGLVGQAVEVLVDCFQLQESLSEVPGPSVCLVEAVRTTVGADYHVHTPLNRKANDALARVTAARLMRRRSFRRPVITVVADLGFALCLHDGDDLTAEAMRELLSEERFAENLQEILANSQVLRERFRRAALTGLMLLRNPLGRRRRVGGRIWGEQRLFDQVRQICPDFVLLRQAEREVQTDVCDATAATGYVEQLTRIPLRIRWLPRPGPFATAWTQTASELADPVESPAEALQRLHVLLTTPGHNADNEEPPF
jgi:Lhr-like helicase